VQLCAVFWRHTLITPAVPLCRKGRSRLSPQKQVVETAGRTGGTQAPCTLKRLPHTEAQAGRAEVKGTISPSGTGIDC